MAKKEIYSCEDDATLSEIFALFKYQDIIILKVYQANIFAP